MSAFDPKGEQVWKWRDAVICMQRERERGAGELERSRKPFNILGHGLR